MPSDIAGGIAAITGLTDAPAALPRLDTTPNAKPGGARPRAVPRADGLTPCSGAKNTANSGGYFTPDEVGALYGVGDLINHGQTGAGQRIAVFELAPHTSSDTSTYFSCFGLHTSVTTVKIDGGGTPDSNGSNGTLEANIDIEEAATQAPGARDHLL